MMFSGDVIDISVHTEITVFCGKLGHCLLNHMLLVDADISLEILYSYEAEIILIRKLPKLRALHHGAVLRHDLTADTALSKSCKSHEIHSSLCVSVSGKHTALS